jgi:hypothetical protein
LSDLIFREAHIFLNLLHIVLFTLISLLKG